jgi:hypothetical protein
MLFYITTRRVMGVVFAWPARAFLGLTGQGFSIFAWLCQDLTV